MSVTTVTSPEQTIKDILSRGKSTDDILDWLQREGISLDLNWGEDTNLWECYFINGRGKRFSSVAGTVRKAIREVIKNMAQEELGMKPYQFKSLEGY